MATVDLSRGFGGRLLWENSAIGIAVADRDRRLLDCNQRLTEMLGYDRSELVGRLGEDFAAEPDTDETVAAIDAVRSGDAPEGMEHCYRRKDGTTIWLRVRAAPIPGTEYFFVFFDDIEAQKELEHSLRWTALELERAQHLGRVGTWAWSPEQDHVLWSAEAIRIYGISPAEAALGQASAFFDRVHPDDRALVDDAIRISRTRGELYRVEHRLVAPDGETRWMRAQGTWERDADDNAVRLVGAVIDITEIRRDEEVRRALEERVQQSQKLEAVGRLAAGVAHDFNNLLTVILGSVELALDEGASSLDPALLREIRYAATRATEMTGDLLAFSRQQPAAPVVVDLNSVVKTIGRLLPRLLGGSIKLTVETSERPLSVLADEGQLEQVVLNLAINARDAMPSGGRLDLRCGRDPDASFGRLDVRDTGGGIPPEIVGKVFDPFFTTKERGKGTGLGLSTAYGIVSSFGGELSVESELGAGATFSVRLPLVDATSRR